MYDICKREVIIEIRFDITEFFKELEDMSNLQDDKIKKALKVAASVFLNPSILYRYEDIIRGVQIGSIRKKAVNVNTTQAFGKKMTYGNFGENKYKAMDLCDEFFIYQKNKIINKLTTYIRTREQMDELGQELYTGLKEALLKYSTLELLDESYNRIRKVVNLYLEHIVAMAEEISNDTRRILVPLLSMPIDSWIIGEDSVFDSIDLHQWGLTRKSTYGEIRRKEVYDSMQQYLQEKAEKISKSLKIQFYVIYFDMFWNERWKGIEGHLFGQNANQNNTNSSIQKVSQTSQKMNQAMSTQQVEYPQLVSAIIAELDKLNIYLDEEYKCRIRKAGEYILEAKYPNKNRKNIITIWANKQGSGDIRLVGIGKYSERDKFDINDLGTEEFASDLLTAYRKTQE